MVNKLFPGGPHEQRGTTFTRGIPPTCRKTQRACGSIASAGNPSRPSGSVGALRADGGLFRGTTPAPFGSRYRKRLSKKERGCACAADSCRTRIQPKAVSGGYDLQWKNCRAILCRRRAGTIRRWRASYENSLVNSVSLARAKSYLTSPHGTSEGLMA